MEVKRHSPRIIEAATVLLQPLVPELTTQLLVDSLQQFDPGKRKLYMTRKEAAARMRVSIVTLHRLINCGKVKAVAITPRAIRIDAASVEALLGGSNNVQSKGKEESEA